MLACADPLYCACLISLGLLGNTDTLIRRRNAQAHGGQTIIQHQVNGQHSTNHAGARRSYPPQSILHLRSDS
ncbi:hypothetical protein EDB19DRAFT_1360604 [Suillus lakei]|nr:hypothetical protein EDB19DRAFT_1360604 [Suillus lakei]